MYFWEEGMKKHLYLDLNHGLAVQRIVRETASHLGEFRSNFELKKYGRISPAVL
jgi:hypothetical protein